MGRHIDAAEVAETLSAKDRNDLARHVCSICGAALLTLEVGRHFRLLHPNDRPEVRPLVGMRTDPPGLETSPGLRHLTGACGISEAHSDEDHEA